MSNLMKDIENLLPSLPKEDIRLGHKLLKERDFDSLQSLVSSAIMKVKKSFAENKGTVDKYKHIDIAKLNVLRSKVDAYCIALQLPEVDAEVGCEEIYDEILNEKYIKWKENPYIE